MTEKDRVLINNLIAKVDGLATKVDGLAANQKTVANAQPPKQVYMPVTRYHVDRTKEREQTLNAICANSKMTRQEATEVVSALSTGELADVRRRFTDKTATAANAGANEPQYMPVTPYHEQKAA